MKLNWFVCLLLVMGGCQKTPPKPLLKPLPSSTSSINYTVPIQTAFKEESIFKLRELIQVIEKSNGNDTFLALAYRRIGSLYNDLHKPDSAIAVTQTALSILRKSSQRNPSDSAKCQANIGIYYLFAEDSYSLDSAKAYLESALVTFQDLKDTSSIFNVQNHLMLFDIKRGDYAHADVIEKSIQSFPDSLKISDGVLNDWYSNLALKALEQLKEDTSKSCIYKHKGVAIGNYRKVVKYLDTQQNEKEKAAIWNNMGSAYIHNQELDSAEAILKDAILILKNTKDKDSIDIINEAKYLNNLAMCYEKPDSIKSILLKADKLLSTLYNNKPHITRTEIYSNLGNLNFKQKKYLEAIDDYQEAIQHACLGNKDYIQQLNQQKVFNFNAPQQLLYPLQRKAEALFQQYLLDKKVDYLLESLKIYETLDDYIIRTRGLMTADESKFAYSEKVVAVYEDAMLVAMTAYRSDKQYADYILRFMGHSKAAVLQESVQQDTAKRSANVPKTVQDQELALKWEIAKAQKVVSDSLHPANAYSSLLKAIQNWESFVRDLETKYPIYYHAKYAGLKVLKINTLQNYLSKDRMIIDYFWGRKTLYTVTITRNYFEIDSCSNIPVLQEQIHKWVDSLSVDIINKPVKDTIAQYSYKLYQQLLEKSLLKLPSPNNIRRLTIIPDGSLNRLPFEALTQKQIQGDDWLKKGERSALIWKYAISYAYSNTLLFGTPKNNTTAPQELGGFGINYNKKYVIGNVEKKPMALRNAEEDVTKAKQLFIRSRTWTESAGNAHVENFYRYAPNYRILYLSMHGVVDKSNPSKSGLIFVKGDSLQLLRLYDIQGLALPYNDLTILSACNTGLGKLSNGEGLISLSRAFSFSGVRNLLTTRWALDANAGSEIIDSFLQDVKQGTPKDIALQKAKQAYLKNNELDKLVPNYWASTVLVGDMEMEREERSIGKVLVIFLMILTLLLIAKRHISHRNA